MASRGECALKSVSKKPQQTVNIIVVYISWLEEIFVFPFHRSLCRRNKIYMAGLAIDGVWMGWYVAWLMDDGLMADVVG